MKSEAWLAVLIALVIAGFLADRQTPGAFTRPVPPTTAVVGR